ncbi:MAG: hypothetical protein KDA61_10065 [Planctomycetales bacterium]|nr:hypothetical protein [Planctomycetales bacterium]
MQFSDVLLESLPKLENVFATLPQVVEGRKRNMSDKRHEFVSAVWSDALSSTWAIGEFGDSDSTCSFEKSARPFRDVR